MTVCVVLRILAAVQIHAHGCVFLTLSLLLFVYLTLSLPILCKWREEQYEECGSSKVRLRYGFKYVLLLLGKAAGRWQPVLSILA